MNPVYSLPSYFLKIHFKTVGHITKSSSHLYIPGSRRVTKSKFHAEEQQSWDEP
jgi:hypothetical protein